MIIRLNFKKYSKKNTFRIRSLMRLLIIVWLSKKYFKQLSLKLFKKNKYSKFHPLVKGPKCHKRGKEILRYIFNQAYVIINYYIDDEININHNYEYFIFMNNIFKNLTTSVYYQHRFDYTNESSCFFL